MDWIMGVFCGIAIGLFWGEALRDARMTSDLEQKVERLIKKLEAEDDE